MELSPPQTIAIHEQPVGYTLTQGNSPTLVCLHGAGCNHFFWSELLPHLAPYACLAASMPGRSPSEGPALRNVEDMAKWVGALLQALHIESFVLIGHSLGGAIALEYALQSENWTLPRPLGLALLTTGAKLRVHQNIFTFLREQQATSTPQSLLSLSWQPQTPSTVKQPYTQQEMSVPIGTTYADWKSANAFDRMADLPHIDLPTLVVGGHEDPYTPPKYSQYLAQHLPHATLSLMQNAGHLLPIEHAQELGISIKQWLNHLKGIPADQVFSR